MISQIQQQFCLNGSGCVVFVPPCCDPPGTKSCKTQTSVRAAVPGVPFTRVFALDKDDPETPNAHLRYSLVSQIPSKQHVLLFQIDPVTGQISTTEQGTSHTLTHTETCHCTHPLNTQT